MVFLQLLVVGLLLITAFAEAQLKCNTDCVKDMTAEYELVTYGCGMPYSSGSVPMLTWHNKQNGEEVPGAQRQQQEGGNVGRKIILQAVAPDLLSLICVARVPNASILQCHSPPCNILYSVRTVVTWPLLYASPGERITCKAKGNPPPNFEWQWMREGGDGKWMDVPDGKTDQIDAQMDNGTSIQLRCMANNTVNGKTHIEHSFVVTVSKSGAAIRTAMIVGIVAASVIVLVVVIIILQKCS